MVFSCGRCCHWGPVTAMVIIKWVSLCTVYCNTMWWPPEQSWGGKANMFGFLILSCLTTYHFIGAMCDGPGYLPPKWHPGEKEDEQYLQFCDVCQGYKAPRTHHCRKCGHCVKKMDHHCPWINNCVGHANHGHFVAFLFFAVLGCLQAAVVLSSSLYYGLHMSWYIYYGTGQEPRVYLTMFTLIAILFGLGLAIGVVLAVGALLFFQLRSIWRNQTGIEDWILEKASYRLKDSEKKFVNPYFLGRWCNLRQVINFGCTVQGNGIDWPLREGAQKYDMTVEQILQKQDKRQRTREYKIVRSFTGSWFPLWSQGFKVTFKPPCTDEPRIALSSGDVVRVTRWKRHWLYGDKVLGGGGGGESDRARVRGWFPRQCAVDLVDAHYPPQQQRQRQRQEGKKEK